MRISLTQGLVGIVALLGALSPLACSGVDAVSTKEKIGEDQSLLKEGACFGEALGGESSCKSLTTWKEYASQSCESRGLTLGDITEGTRCEEGLSDIKYSCCKPAPKPLPPRPGPNPPACFGDSQGGPTSCKPAELWTKYANQLCVDRGSKIAHIAFTDECAPGSFRWTKYECCSGDEPTPEPPTPEVCRTALLGGETSCKPNALWKEYAFDFCRQSESVLSELSIVDACGPDHSRQAKVTCCVAAPPFPEPPTPEPTPEPTDPTPDPTPEPPRPTPEPGACTYGYEKTQICTAPEVWKRIGVELCEKQGLRLNDLSLGGGCERGGSFDAKYACCK